METIRKEIEQRGSDPLIHVEAGRFYLCRHCYDTGWPGMAWPCPWCNPGGEWAANPQTADRAAEERYRRWSRGGDE